MGYRVVDPKHTAIERDFNLVEPSFERWAHEGQVARDLTVGPELPGQCRASS